MYLDQNILPFSLMLQKCTNFFIICINWSKQADLYISDFISEKYGLFYLRFQYFEEIDQKVYVIKNFIPQYRLSNGYIFFISKIKKIFDTDIVLATSIFFYLISLMLFLLIIFCVFKSKSKNKRLITAISGLFILLNLYTYNFFAEYLVYSYSSLIAFIIIINFDYKKKIFINYDLMFFLIPLSILIFGNLRQFSFINILLVFIFLTIYSKYKYFDKIKIYFLAFFSLIILFSSNYYFSNKKNNEVLKINKNYVSKKNTPGNNLFLTFYPGLSFVNNKNIPSFSDDENWKLIFNSDKNFEKTYGSLNEFKKYYNITSAESVSIVKKEIFNVLINNPLLILKNIFAKIGVLFMALLLITNLFLYKFIKTKEIHSLCKKVIFLNLLAQSTFPIIAIPNKFYGAGFISASFCLILVIFAFQKNNFKNFFQNDFLK